MKNAKSFNKPDKEVEGGETKTKENILKIYDIGSNQMSFWYVKGQINYKSFR